MSERENLQKARDLISAKNYDEARAILGKMPQNQTAQKWLAKLDEIAPSKTQYSTKPQNKLPPLIIVLFMIILVAVGAFLIGRTLNNDDQNTIDQEQISGNSVQQTMDSLVATNQAMQQSMDSTVFAQSTLNEEFETERQGTNQAISTALSLTGTAIAYRDATYTAIALMPSPTSTSTNTPTSTRTPTPSPTATVTIATPTIATVVADGGLSGQLTIYYTNIENANARSCPNTSCDVVKQLSRGTPVGVVEIVDGENVLGSDKWFHTKLPEGDAYLHESVLGSTPPPRATNTPTITRTPTKAPETKQLGPIYDSLYNETISVVMTVSSVKFSRGDSFTRPGRGNTFVIVEVSFQNLGPGIARFIGPTAFKVRDSNGALRDSAYVPEATYCEMDYVDLQAGGSIGGCIGFEVPETGSLELLYAPYYFDNLEEGRYLRFKLR